MKTIRIPVYGKLGSFELSLFRDGIEENFSNFVMGLMTPGLIIKRLTNGILSTDFLVTGSGPLNVNAGYLTYNDSGKIRIVKFSSVSIPIDAITYPNGIYYVCIKPKVTNYENGTLTFTNGSDIVVSSLKGSFKYFRPGAAVIIENSDTLYGNAGSYKVISTAIDSVRLDKIFTGITESGLKWKIEAEFPGNYSTPDSSGRLAYEYDGYDLLLRSSPTGFELASIRTQSGTATIFSDRRPSYLANFNSNNANADDILSGAINNITTIEEKASAARLDKIVKGYYSKGIRTGLTVAIAGLDLIRVAAGDAIDGNGKFIVLPATSDINIRALFNQSIIVDGDNYLHIYYISPNGYAWYWSTAESSNASHVSITKIIFDPSNLNQE